MKIQNKILGKKSSYQNGNKSLWIALLVAASIVFSFAFACALPFVACCTAAAITLPRKDALVLTGGLWFANQAVGFSFLNYPWTADTIAWGLVIGATAILSTMAAQLFANYGNGIKQIVVSFLFAFVVYEVALFSASLILGGIENYTLEIQGKIFAVNALALPALLILNNLGVAIGIAPSRILRLSLVPLRS
jgi:hypothetical protein